MARSARSVPIEIGDVIADKYRIERELGKGGMGVVLGAMHLKLDARVALKVLFPEFASSQTIVQRFAREARAAAKIESEHIARVLDVGSVRVDRIKLPFIVMEYLEGKDLGAQIDRSGPLSIVDAVDYLLEACQALAEAHAQQIVHRDLKPSNLFLATRADGTQLVKVLDFGISKALARDPEDDDLSLTRPTDVFGSPRYMSPEQLRASCDVDARCDIWALGVVLFELLTGKTPFTGASVAEVHAAVLERQPPRVRDLNPDIPEAIDDAIMRCLQKDMLRRYTSVSALAHAIAAYGARSAERSLEVIERWHKRTTAPVERVTTPFIMNEDLDVSEIRSAITGTRKGTAPDTHPPALPHPVSSRSGATQLGLGPDGEEEVHPEDGTSPGPSAGSVTNTTWGRDSVPGVGRARRRIVAGATLLLAVGTVVAWQNREHPDDRANQVPAASVVSPLSSPVRTTSPSKADALPADVRTGDLPSEDAPTADTASVRAPTVRDGPPRPALRSRSPAPVASVASADVDPPATRPAGTEAASPSPQEPPSPAAPPPSKADEERIWGGRD